MRNLWVQMEQPFATWVADFERIKDRPGDLVDFTVDALRWGEELGVFTVLDAPEIGYRRAQGAALPNQLRELYRTERKVDLFGFTGLAAAPELPGSSTVEGVIAWYDQHDKVVSGPCIDLGALLRRLEPTEGSISPGFTEHFPPLRVEGRRHEYGGDPAELLNYHPMVGVLVRFGIHSDIWFPWIWGSAHPHCDYERMFDNRELSGVHTPRLNEFLRRVGERARALGGAWSVDRGDTGKDAGRWLDENGIFLDREPEAKMPTQELEAEWF